ncbi:iron ABC transporter permease (plasmid) [Azospirillum brasilense]|uniref:Iron ABC transporter permease n=1 Tax=Azospirillum brasilense TaxID=192 RepID=A0A0P0EIS7_AZOBR|nr:MULTISPECIES: iron ABC transporter permease [Azospirillum]ALJ37849.1 ABC transporter permease [Azospirillum brasilense]MDW7554829.1 iron ABC transporter permease [Azospirillum brasilense]MDW7597168.1 iron ABC transporter permease [Azospirillum brasilense]MDW7632009.1 iron ABC transporter permease [Azospirillum brasilense]MDX5951948.1 iron ABC transporter permease [Azospirillum brasilense]
MSWAMSWDSRIPYPALVAGLTLLALMLCAVSAAVGYVPFDLGTALSDWLAGRPTLGALVLAELRLPRALLGLLVGFSLGLTGAAMQGWLRNPLAEPGLVGVSSAAALGAVIVFYSGLSAALSLALPLGGMAGAATAAVLLNLMAARGAGTTALVIGGIAINSLAGSLTALALNLAPNPYAALEIVFWLMGSLADRGTDQLWLVLPPMLAGWALCLSGARALDALTLGEDAARSLGFDLTGLRVRLIAGAALAVGSAVSVTGAVGFVGLVAPHLMRPLAGARPGRLLLLAGLAGACLTLAADIAVRLLPTRPELKLGVVTALIGAPFLIVLIARLRREEA